MADKMSKMVLPVKTGDTIVNKEFEFGGSDNLGTAAYKDIPSSGNASSSQVVMGNDSRLSDSRNAKDVAAWAKAATKPTYTASEVGAIASSTKGAANGVAELDSSGKVPSSQLPSYVDDVLEYDSQSAFPSTGETGKIYVAKDTNKSYRWTGSAYSQIKGDLALGETSSTAYRGDRGKAAYDHSQSTHARTDATKTEASSTNGNIKINGTETKVYTHPGSGTNPHGTTKSDVGLGNVGNFKAVSTVANQGLSDTEKANARTNIGAGTSSFSGSYNDLTNKPTIPTVNNATLTIQKNGTTVKTFTANASSNVTANITVPTKTSELTNDSSFVSSDTKNTAGSTDTSSKIFLIGATSQAANPQTYSHDTAYVGTDGCLYSGGSKVLTALPSHNHDDRYYTESEVNQIIDGLKTGTNKTQQMIAPIQTTLVALKAYAVGEQFVYNGLLYEVTAAIASGGTITIDGNCKLADTVTNQILLLISELNKLKNATRRTRRNITTDLANLPTAVAEQNLEKYGYTIGDYFIGNSGYTYFLADMNTFRGANNDYAVINQNHISIVVKTGANSKWNETNDTSTGYSRSVLHSYLSGTVLNNIKSDMIALFGGSTGLEHLLSHKLIWTTAVSNWDWSAAAQYISALTEPQVYGTNVLAIDGYQTGEAWKHLELFKKFSYMEILGWIWFWLRSIYSASGACAAGNNGSANAGGASASSGVVGLIQFK